MYKTKDMTKDSRRSLAASRKRRYERRCKEKGIQPIRSGRVNLIQVAAAVALPTLTAVFA